MDKYLYKSFSVLCGGWSYEREQTWDGVYIYINTEKKTLCKLFAYVQKIRKSEENTWAFANVGLLHVFLKHLELIRNTLVFI